MFRQRWSRFRRKCAVQAVVLGAREAVAGQSHPPRRLQAQMGPLSQAQEARCCWQRRGTAPHRSGLDVIQRPTCWIGCVLLIKCPQSGACVALPGEKNYVPKYEVILATTRCPSEVQRGPSTLQGRAGLPVYTVQTGPAAFDSQPHLLHGHRIVDRIVERSHGCAANCRQRLTLRCVVMAWKQNIQGVSISLATDSGSSNFGACTAVMSISRRKAGLCLAEYLAC